MMSLPQDKIYILTPYFHPAKEGGGPVISLKNLVNNVNKNFVIITSNLEVRSRKKIFKTSNAIIRKQIGGNDVFYFNFNNTIRFIFQYLKIIKTPRLVYINSFFNFKFSFLPILLFKKIILSPRGELSPEALAKKKYLKKIYLSLFKIVSIRNNIVFHSTSSVETVDIYNLFPKSRIVQISNLSLVKKPKSKSIKKNQNELKILYISRILPHKNLNFVIETLSRLSKLNIELSIYGVIEDQKYWELCLEKLKAVDFKFNFYGYVNNEDLGKIFSNHHLFFLPTLGENFGHIISESLQYSCPVLISDQTPWKKLSNFKCGWDISLGNEDKFSEKILEMYLMENDEFQIMKDGCFNAFEKNYNLKGTILNYNNLFT